MLPSPILPVPAAYRGMVVANTCLAYAYLPVAKTAVTYLFSLHSLTLFGPAYLY